MIRQKLALVVSGSPFLALKRMNGFSPVKMTRLGSAVVMANFPPSQTGGRRAEMAVSAVSTAN
jgi:hypothetical protein